MSATKQTTLWCEEPGCPKWEQYDYGRASAARREAARDGWTYSGGRDRCPNHPSPPHKPARTAAIL